VCPDRLKAVNILSGPGQGQESASRKGGQKKNRWRRDKTKKTMGNGTREERVKDQRLHFAGVFSEADGWISIAGDGQEQVAILFHNNILLFSERQQYDIFRSMNFFHLFLFLGSFFSLLLHFLFLDCAAKLPRC
jgi:hypothetical protein